MKAKGIESVARGAALKVGIFNAVAFFIGLALTFLIKSAFVPAFAAGYILGVVNVFWLLRIARRGVLMEAEKAGRFVTFSYFVRFAITTAVLGMLISTGMLSPWPMLAGLSGAIFTTIGVLFFIAREEAS